jgi:hypothetical protein
LTVSLAAAHIAIGREGRAAMPVRIIGMIGVAPPTGDASLHVIEGGYRRLI